MTLSTVLLMLLAAVAGPTDALTFEEAVAAAMQAGSQTQTDDSLEPLRGARAPELRVETTGSAGRTLDPFTADPLDSEAFTTALMLHYPLWDGGARRAQVAALEARASSRESHLSDARFAALVSSFGELYLAQRQEAILRPVHEMLASEAARSLRLLEAAEITALEASGRRALAATYASQLLDVEARRDEAQARLQEVLRIEVFPELALDESPAVPRIELDAVLTDDRVRAADRVLDESRARERAVAASSGFTATLSALAGATTARSEYHDLASSGTYGIYGVRVHLSYPLFRNANVAAAETRLAVQESTRMRAEASEAARQHVAALLREERTISRRIALLQEQLEESRVAAASVERLVEAGLRPRSEVAFSTADVAGREVTLAAAVIQRWKIVQQLRWLAEPRDRS